MSCEEFTDLFDLYAVGSLEKAEADELRTHLDTGCEQCGPRFIKALMLAAEISETVDLVDPPAGLRNRIAASVGGASNLVTMPEKKARPSIAPWLAVAASLAALAIGIGYEENARRTQQARMTAQEASSKAQAEQMAALEARSKAEAEHTAAMLSILQSPGTKQVAFSVDKVNVPHGALFIHREYGIAMVVAHLPSAPSGFKYETWVVPKAGSPQPVESFNTDKTGFAFTVVRGPVDPTKYAAVAVSIEPADSTPVKPTKVLFASPV